MMNHHQSLYSALEDYGKGDVYPMHMPGHKRNSALPSTPLPWHLDITEIDGFDNLHEPSGILQEAQRRAAGLWGSDHAFFLVGGSTSGILAGIYACTGPGDRVLMGRNCHKSVYHAVELLGLRPVYLEPPVIAGICGSVPPEAVDLALTRYPDIRLAVITSPTYEGVVSDIDGIALNLHNAKIPLLVDEAHGAHFGISPYFPESAISSGADIVIHSLHKTLPSLTQTAMAHLGGELVSRETFRHALAVFQSSSPSYPLMASIDGCVGDLADRGGGLLRAWRERLDSFRAGAEALAHLSLFTGDGVFAHDPSKLVILTGETACTGGELASTLRRDYGIELEMAGSTYALAMTGLGDTDEGFRRLAEALGEIDGTLAPAGAQPPASSLPPLPPQRIPAGEALRAGGKLVAFRESEGLTAGEYIWAYPPGIPLVTPGAEITGELIEAVAEMTARSVELHSTWGRFPEAVRVICENEFV